MQAGFKSISRSGVTHVNFAQAARVRAMDRAWESLAALSVRGNLLGQWAAQAGPQVARRLQLVVVDTMRNDLPMSTAVRLFASNEPQAEPCEAMRLAKRRAALESLL